MSNLNVNYANRPGVAIDIVRNINQPNDVITLNALARENASDDNNSRSTAATAAAAAAAAAVNSATPQPTTPIPAKKLNNKWLTNLSLQISKTKYADQVETANAALSDVTLTTDTAGAANNESSRDVETATNSSSSAGTTFPYEYQKTVKRLDISFDNVKFAVTTGFFKREHKQILNGLTGKFRAGELSAIVGPSGAGKSTLLNFLSSYTPYGYTGDIMVNDKLRNTTAFKPNVAFITQDTSLQPFLRVKEAMHFAANLKIGSHMTKNQKRERVRTILKAIGMYDNRHMITGNLSGGQKKRLAIALELVNNPPVLILDEPTSGLDSSISNQCISLLKKLALEGRAIICTIHQPSALSFEMFDHLYAIAEGRCIYAGATQNLVPFLAEIDLHCPKSYNPADFLMEIATNDYGPLNDKLVEKIENGRNNTYRHNLSARKTQMEAMRRVDKMSEGGLMTPVTAPVLSLGLAKTPNHRQQQEQQQQQEGKPLQFKQVPEMSSRVWDSCGILSSNETEHNIIEAQPQLPSPVDNTCCKSKKPKLQIDPGNLCKRENIYASPFYRQLGILLVRTFLILWRDSSLATMRLVIHFVIAVLIGLLYYGIGNDASNALNNFRYTFYTIMFIMYCAFSSILVKFPLEFPIVSREHFNRWYSLRAYYIAITLADIPIQLICTSLFIFTTYLLTGQPWELLRIALFSFIVFLTALVGQSIGLAVGASLSVQLGAILGPFFILPFLAFSGFFLQRKDSPVYLTWMFDISFLKYSLDGAMLALFGYDRAKLECTSMYCHYSRPTFFLKDLDMMDANYELAAVFLLLLFLGLRIIAFYIMSFRLRLFR